MHQQCVGRDEPILEPDLWRPWIETAVTLFGTKRCMTEGDHPPDARSDGYVPVWTALKAVSGALAAEEKADLFWRTATPVHRIELPTELIALRPEDVA